MDKKRKKPNIFLRLLTFLLTLALVAGAFCLVLFREELNVDALKRYITYRSLTKDATGRAESFPYDGSLSDVYANLNGSLLVAGGSGIRLYSPAGVLLEEDQTILKTPAIHTEGKYAVVYDLGGTALRLYTSDRQLLALDDEGTLLFATVNSSGWLAVTHQAGGHKGAVTVFDGRQERKMQFHFSSRFVTDALVSEDNDTLAVVTIGQEEDGFRSTLLFYSLSAALDAGSHSDTAPTAQHSLGNVVCLALSGGSGTLRLPGDNSLTLCGGPSGSTALYDYNGRYLKEFSLGGDRYTALLLGKYRAGNAAELVIVDDRGQTTGELSLAEQVLSLSAAGRYIGILTADRLDIYTQDMTLYSSLEGTAGARKILMQPDGSALLIGSAAAQFYLPN